MFKFVKERILKKNKNGDKINVTGNKNTLQGGGYIGNGTLACNGVFLMWISNS